MRAEHFACASVVVDFGGLRAVNGISLKVSPGEILGVIGPNGAGKSTLFNVLTGYQRPTSGRVTLGSQDITAVTPEKRSQMGVARTFQIERPFAALTVRENIASARTPRDTTLAIGLEAADRLLEDFGLGEFAHTRAGDLPGGLKRRLELARAMAADPSVLLLDEVMAGLAPTEADEMAHLVAEAASRGTAVVLIEHVLRVVRLLCDRVLAMNFGQHLTEGRADEVMRHPDVVTAYLGAQGEEVGT